MEPGPSFRRDSQPPDGVSGAGESVRRIILTIALAAGVSGCATYRATPLPTAPELAAEPPSRPMAMAAVARFALAHSPDLVAARRKAQVSAAQADEGGLLPDPQFSASADHPTVHGLDLVNGYALGLSQDLQALLTQPARAESAAAKAKQARLDLLWAEWQTIQKAASLDAQKVFADQKLALLSKTAEILRAQSDRSARALAGHNTTIDLAGADLSAALDIASQRDAAARAAIAADSDLKALLGIAPTATLALAAPGEPPSLTQAQMNAALRNVRRMRPDLLALRAGYHAQDEAVWTAILQQFPAINVGFNRASDTSNIQSNGLAVTVNIPIFGSTEAKIRTERASRAQLRAEYQARLDQTTADAWRTWRALKLVREQVARLEQGVPELRRMAATGRKAYAAGNLAPATYVLLETSLSSRESELLDLRTTLWADTIALRTLLALTPVIPNVEAPQ